MSIKNLIIAALIMSNAATLFLIYQNRNGFAISRQLMCMYSLNDSDEVDHAAVFREYILTLYADAIASCGAAVSVQKQSSFSGTPAADMACLLAGKRTVIWETLQNVNIDLENQYEMFEMLAKSEGIREIHCVSFSQEGERNALLLTKAELTRDVDDEINSGINPYLFGLLLGYDLKDIEFYFQRSRFMAENEGDVPFSYAAFSKELKNQFDSFVQLDWLQSGGIADFEKDKIDALQWIKDQEVYSIDDLYKQIDELKKESSRRVHTPDNALTGEISGIIV